MKVKVRDLLKALDGLDPERPVRFFPLDDEEGTKELEIVSLYNAIDADEVSIYLD